MTAPLIPLGSHVAVDPSKVIAVRVRDGVPQVKVEPDGAWIDAIAYTDRPDQLLTAVNAARVTAGATTTR